ncbi:hypothetical protein NL108_003246, partial [Boleophthalmus pectinirostris]
MWQHLRPGSPLVPVLPTLPLPAAGAPHL